MYGAYLCDSKYFIIMLVLPEIEIFYQALGERIKTERLKRKISQENLASHLDLTRASVINLEKGRHRPSIYQLISIANFFKIDYDSLIPYVSKSPNPRSKKLSPDLRNIVTDQEKIDKPARDVINNFLSAIKNKL